MSDPKVIIKVATKNRLRDKLRDLLISLRKVRSRSQNPTQTDTFIKEELRRVNRLISEGGNQIDTKRLTQLIYLKDLNQTYLKRGFPYSILLAAIIIVASIYLIQRRDSTTVLMELDVSSVYARTFKELNLVRNSNNFLNDFYSQISFDARLSDSAYGNSDNSHVTIRNRSNDNSLYIKSLNIPMRSEMVISRPIPGELNLDVKQKGKSQLSGQIFLDEGSIITDREVKLNKSKVLDLASPYVIGFTKNFDDNDVFNLSLSNPSNFQLSRLYIDSIAFIESNTTNDINYSSILSGTIRLLDTDKDSIMLSENDSLNILLDGDPARISITLNETGIHINVEAEVSRLIAGSSILASSRTFYSGNKLNQMPMRYQTMPNLVPFLVASLSGIAPILFSMIIKPGKAHL